MALYGITNLVVKRGTQNDGASVSATWGFSGNDPWGYDESWYDEVWTFNASKNMSSAVTQQTGAGPATGDIVWTRNGDSVHNDAYCHFNREKYHPFTWQRYLVSVTADIVHGASTFSPGRTDSSVNKHGKMTFAFQLPKVPEIAEPDYDESTGIVTFKVDAAEDEGPYERYDTMYCITRQDSSNRGNSFSSEKIVAAWHPSTEDSIEATYDMSDAQSVTYGQWVKVTCKAYSRGVRGDSATVTKVFYYSYPAQASITSIVASGLTSTDSVTVRLSTNATAAYPVDQVKLQRLRSSTITSADSAGMAEGWADVSGAVDNGVCTGLVDYVEDAMPEVRTHTWYRLVTTHGSLVRRSLPVEAVCLYRAKDAVADDEVTFVSLIPGADGTSLIARLAWNDDDSNLTQISWSQYEDAWESTEQPSIVDVTWEDTEPATGFQYSATVTIRGLEEGTAYYVRARRALKSGDTESYGDWCYPDKAYYPVNAAIAPTDVVLWAPATVERGNGVDCAWTYSGSQQTAWQVLYKDSEGNVREMLSGEGSAGAAIIPAASVEGLDSLLLAVSVTAGGDWASSDYIPVTIADAPKLTLSIPTTLTAQPLSLGFTSTSPNSQVTAYITSRGVFTATPDGSKVQASGDVVWAEALSPSWVASGDVWAASVTAPEKLELYDGATYDVTVVAVDTQTLLSSDGVQASFDVAWAHSAYAPSTESVIAVDGLTATITPVTPVVPEGTDDEVASTDVCDVYRHTPDGAYLIASDVPFGQPVTDRFAPFASRAELDYRLCTRTADGDLAWAEYPYTLRHGALRLDWGGESVELPYNVTVSDAWEKGFEMRQHLDGTQAGYWDAGTARKASLSTDVVKVESAEKREALASLAKYAGPVFVRTPDGCAYPANVTVDSYGVSYDSGAVPVSISAEEVAITGEHRISPDDWGDA